MINTNNNLILVKEEDKTSNIDSWEYRDGKYAITFLGGKTYLYNYGNVQFYKEPKIIDVKNTIVLKNNVPLYSLHKVLVFPKHTRISFKNGFTETLKNNQLTYINSVLTQENSKNCLTYLKHIAREVSIKTEDGQNILGHRYEKVDFVREDSVLATYLSGKLHNELADKKEVVFPFGFNLSQKQAVENALKNSLSVIEGPPGTGKTQTILNIIANAVMRGESVAVVSSNNSATQNVLDKLKKYSVGFIAAYLGNDHNKKKFIQNQDGLRPNVDEWNLEQEEYISRHQEVSAMAVQLNEMLDSNNMLSKFRQEYQDIRTEHEHFMQYYEETNMDDIELNMKADIAAKKVMKLLVGSEMDKSSGKISLFRFVINFFQYGIKNRSFYQNSQERRIAICQKKYYELILAEIQASIKQLEIKLEGYDFEEKMKEYSKLSMLLFRGKLSKKYKGNKQRKLYEQNDLWKNPQDFTKEYPVILSTAYSLRSSLSEQFVYDYVIVDEASQVDLVTGSLACSCAKKAVIVGDLKQLPNVVKEDVKQRTDTIFNQYKLPEAYRYSTHSLLASIRKLFEKIPHTLLKEHYRCHPQIIGFCNQKFYNGELIILTANNQGSKPLMVYKTVEGNHSRERVNIRQIDVITNEVIPQQGLDVARESIGIVTPYRNQTECLQKSFSGTNIQADTVDKFQGRECDTIILSTVDDKITEFADNPNRLNVAVSRAVNKLIVVTDGNESTKETNLKDLIGYIQYHNCEVIESKIYSIFDYLYKSYSESREQYLKDKKRISEFESENLMYEVIREVLGSKEDFSKYGIAVHVPLRMILRDITSLEDKEVQYVMAAGTHVDFLIFSKLSRTAVLVVEVDGYEFHKNGSRQEERDRLKDSIMYKFKLPYIRFKTNESDEQKRLLEILVKCTQ